jgi:hypothetical protein
MAGQPANTFSAYDAKGLREDLSDIIYRIDPTEVPFQSNIGRTKATAKRHEWQVQTLASATNANAVIEGDDATTDAATPTVRVSNITQISDKVAQVTGTLEAVDKAGRDSEMEYQVLLKGLELRRDIEMRLTSNKASVVGSNTIASECAGFEAWITSNVSRDASGASGGFSATTGLVEAATDGNKRTFTEALLKTVMQSSFQNAGSVARPTILQLGPFNKAKFSGFTGIADIRKDVAGKSQAVIIGAADVYVSDFGNLNVVPSVFQRDRTAMLYNPKYIKLATLRPMKNWALAKTGDTERRQILAEYTLEMCNQAACGVVADLIDS